MPEKLKAPVSSSESMLPLLKPGTGQSFDLEYIRLEVPLRPPLTLMDNYDGAVMLSNLRFNVIMQFSPHGNELCLTLKPRSTKGMVAASKIKELSFMLSGVIVRQYVGNPVSVKIGVIEQYNEKPEWENDLYVRLVPPKPY
ncbi:hypothetical protein QBC43DRAFT_285643 [Cladorrhinum sp. PSN259]|nr:hypothetical protein QBC43DRAFT_285643 [Cladorrhinum sp. PSN259]